MTVKDVFVAGKPMMEDVIKQIISTHRDVSKIAESTRDMEENKGKTQEELEAPIWTGYHDKFKKAYEDILATEIVPHPEEICTVICYKDENGYYSYDVSSINVDEFMSKFIYDKPPIKNYEDIMNAPLDVISYSLMFIPREDLLGYTISDVSFDLYSIMDIIVELLWELTWFGYSNEEVEENIKAEQEYLDSDYDEDDFVEFDDSIFEDVDHEDDIVVLDKKKDWPSALDKELSVTNRITTNAYYRKLYDWIKSWRNEE